MKTTHLSLFLLLIFLSINQPSFAQADLFSYENYVNEQGDSLPFRLLIPDYAPGIKYPLVIFLHGSGERGNDNEAQLTWGVLNFASDYNLKMHPAIVLAPQCPKKLSWDNLSEKTMTMQKQPSKTLELVMELIAQAKKTLAVDTNRIYITGLSMGGFGTFDAISRYPNVFAAAVPVCGAGDPKQAAKFAHIPMWIFHGALDDAVSPSYSRDMLMALSEEGASPGYTQYPSVGHFAWIAAYSDPMMMQWLFRQSKGN
tara:strand:- start:2591 stop:3358 length:768 start_codon:yes stop_codon:yes gene_type:complete